MAGQIGKRRYWNLSIVIVLSVTQFNASILVRCLYGDNLVLAAHMCLTIY